MFAGDPYTGICGICPNQRKTNNLIILCDFNIYFSINKQQRKNIMALELNFNNN